MGSNPASSGGKMLDRLKYEARFTLRSLAVPGVILVIGVGLIAWLMDSM